jgi:hypothetical protein
MLTKENINQINDKLKNKVVNVITNKFSDLDLVRHYENNYNVRYLDDSLSWNKFIEWITASISGGSFFRTKKPTIYIVNLDLIPRIPNKKTKKSMSLEELVETFRFHTEESIIFFSEKPVNKSKLKIKPLIIGNIPDYSNKIWMVTTLLYGDDFDEKKRILENVNFETIKSLVFFNGIKHPKFAAKLIEYNKWYERLKYETKPKTIKNMLLNLFTEKLEKKTVRFPPFYKELFKLSDVVSDLNIL